MNHEPVPSVLGNMAPRRINTAVGLQPGIDADRGRASVTTRAAAARIATLFTAV
jgi:hypothetical protein